MKVNRHFSLTFVFGFPAIIISTLLALIAKNHLDAVEKEVTYEYQRVINAFERTTTVLTALDYSFSNYYKSINPLFLDHNKHVVDGVCRIWPIDGLLLADGKTADIPSVDINYMLVGDETLCSELSDTYQSASEKVALAPILSFLAQLDDYYFGVHFIDATGYVISSPEDFAKGLSKELLSTVKSRPYWQRTANNPQMLTLTGPIYRPDTLDRVMSMTIPVFYKGSHQGMLSVDIDSQNLLRSESHLLAGQVDIVDLTNKLAPDDAIWVQPLELNGVAAHHLIFYRFDLVKELKTFLKTETDSVFVALTVYLFMVTIFFYINSTIEKGYFKELAAKDPMTGLLNRRGLEAFWRNVQHDELFVLVVFDIDNFKSINDTFGHDKGDEVIRYMARQIHNGIRSSDAGARFGGEEFVLYLKGEERQTLKNILHRVKTAICEQSTNVVEGGFTVSGGACIVESDSTQLSFDEVFKCADEKLYIAKTTGKNKIEF